MSLYVSFFKVKDRTRPARSVRNTTKLNESEVKRGSSKKTTDTRTVKPRKPRSKSSNREDGKQVHTKPTDETLKASAKANAKVDLKAKPPNNSIRIEPPKRTSRSVKDEASKSSFSKSRPKGERRSSIRSETKPKTTSRDHGDSKIKTSKNLESNKSRPSRTTIDAKLKSRETRNVNPRIKAEDKSSSRISKDGSVSQSRSKRESNDRKSSRNVDVPKSRSSLDVRTSKSSRDVAKTRTTRENTLNERNSTRRQGRQAI